MFSCLRNTTNMDKVIFALLNIWLLGFFLLPSSKLHYQIFLVSVVMSGFWLIFTLKLQYKVFLHSSVLRIALLYALFFFISVAWSNDSGFAEKSKDIKTFLYLIFFALVFLFALDGQSKRLTLMIISLLVAAALSLLINLVLFYGVEAEPLRSRFAGMGRLWNPLWASAMYGATALIALSILLEKFAVLTRMHRGLLVLLYLSMLTAVLLTQSRTPIAAVMLLSLLLIMMSGLSVRIKSAVLSASLFSGGLLLLVFLPIVQNFIARGQSYRLDLWLGFIERAKEHLIFGHGGGSTVPISSSVEQVDGWYHYHSTYIASLVEMGLIGLTLHLVMILTVLSAAWKMRSSYEVRLAVVIFVYVCILGLTFGHGILTRMNTQWLLYWMPLLVIVMHELKYQQLSVRR